MTQAARPWWIIVVAVLVPSTAGADVTHYNDYPLGGRAVGLGGAFTAISNEPSGIYYNPAGLVDATQTTVSVSSNLYGIEIETRDEDIFQGFSDRFGDFEEVFAQLNIIPTSAGLVSWFGDLGEDGKPNHSYALGVFVPSYTSVNIQTVGDDGDGNRVAYRRNLLDIMFHAGAAYSTRIDEIWSFGFSTAFIYRQLRDLEESTWFEQNPAFEQAAFRTSQTNIGVFVGALVMTFGLKVRLDDRWTAGLTVSTPSIEIYDTATLRVVQSRANADTGAVTFQLEDPEDLEAATTLAGNLRLGAAHVIPNRATFAFDLIMHAPTSYTLLEIKGGAAGIKDTLTTTTDIENEITINAATGIELQLTDELTFAAGFFTNFSSAPRIPEGETFERDHLPHVDIFGGTLVVGHASEYTLTRAGFNLSYGSGESVIPTQSPEERSFGRHADFQRIDVRKFSVYFFVSSTFRY